MKYKNQTIEVGECIVDSFLIQRFGNSINACANYTFPWSSRYDSLRSSLDSPLWYSLSDSIPSSLYKSLYDNN